MSCFAWHNSAVDEITTWIKIHIHGFRREHHPLKSASAKLLMYVNVQFCSSIYKQKISSNRESEVLRLLRPAKINLVVNTHNFTSVSNYTDPGVVGRCSDIRSAKSRGG